jgi:ATP-dependent Lon protease
MISNPVAVAELAVERGASILIMPISSGKKLFDFSDDMATKISIEFYANPADACLKAITE